MKKAYLVLCLIGIVLASCTSSKRADLGDGLFADIKTSKGDIIVKLAHEQTPVTVANFVSLAEGKNPFVDEKYKDKPYYNGIIFHRVIKDFMIQGGDPDGTGRGNPGYKFMDETNDSLVHDKKGILSMANAGPGTNGSQFFITHKETPFLNGRHTVFGAVVEGLSVVDSIANVETGTGDKPVVDVVMNTVEIIRNGKEARKFDAVAVMTDYFAKEGERLAAEEKANAEREAVAQEERAALAAVIPTEKEKAKELPSGLRILSLKEGKGEKPKIGQQVLVMYAGFLENGSLFDSNYEEIARKYNKYDDRRAQGGGYRPIPMVYSSEAQLIAGFKEALMTMKVGDKIRVFIPPHLGYGEQGSRNVIPPNADLVFDLEIAGIAQ